MKKNIKYMFLLCIMILGIINVNAGTIDTSGLTYEFLPALKADDIHGHVEIKIDGISLKESMCIIFTDSTQRPQFLNNNNEIDLSIWQCFSGGGLDTKTVTLNDRSTELYESNSNLYMFIADYNAGSPNYSEAIKIDRTPFFDLGKRIFFNYIDDSGLSTISFKDQVYSKSNINYKIGIISDNNIISDISKDNANFSDILEFAKNDSDGKKGSATRSNVASEIYNSISNYDASKYYYVYVYFDDYNLEDINYYTYDSKLKVLEAGKKLKYTGSSTSGSGESIPLTEKDLPKNPNTGISTWITGAVIISIGFGSLYILKNKKELD